MSLIGFDHGLAHPEVPDTVGELRRGDGLEPPSMICIGVSPAGASAIIREASDSRSSSLMKRTSRLPAK